MFDLAKMIERLRRLLRERHPQGALMETALRVAGEELVRCDAGACQALANLAGNHLSTASVYPSSREHLAASGILLALDPKRARAKSQQVLRELIEALPRHRESGFGDATLTETGLGLVYEAMAALYVVMIPKVRDEVRAGEFPGRQLLDWAFLAAEDAHRHGDAGVTDQLVNMAGNLLSFPGPDPRVAREHLVAWAILLTLSPARTGGKSIRTLVDLVEALGQVVANDIEGRPLDQPHAELARVTMQRLAAHIRQRLHDHLPGHEITIETSQMVYFDTVVDRLVGQPGPSTVTELRNLARRLRVLWSTYSDETQAEQTNDARST